MCISGHQTYHRQKPGERVKWPVETSAKPQPLRAAGPNSRRTGLRDGDVVAIHKTPAAESGQVVVARFGDEVMLKRFVRIDERHVELRPESYNPAHKVMKLDLAKHVLEIDGVAVGALIAELRDAEEERDKGERPKGPVRMIPKTHI